MRLRCLLLSLACLLFALEAAALGLYGVLRSQDGPGGAVSDTFVRLDPATGAGQAVGALPIRIWNDLAGRPGDASHAYAVSRLPGADFANAVSRVDTATGAVTDLYDFRASDFGYFGQFVLEFTGLSFVPGDSSEALVLGAFVDTSGAQPSEMGLFRLDLDTGDTSPLVTNPSFLTQLTHAPDGTLLTRSPPFVATLDPATAALGLVGSTSGLSITAFALHPGTGELFATDGNVLAADDLVLLSSSDATLQEVRGSVGLVGSVNALAFVVPEPTTGTLLLAGLVALAARRRR